jgi:hypothetical protein
MLEADAIDVSYTSVTAVDDADNQNTKDDYNGHNGYMSILSEGVSSDMTVGSPEKAEGGMNRELAEVAGGEEDGGKGGERQVRDLQADSDEDLSLDSDSDGGTWVRGQGGRGKRGRERGGRRVGDWGLGLGSTKGGARRRGGTGVCV